LNALADYITTKRIIAPALNTLVASPSKLFECSRGQIRGAIHSLVHRIIKGGGIGEDLEHSIYFAR
jgi:hypothetical protein